MARARDREEGGASLREILEAAATQSGMRLASATAVMDDPAEPTAATQSDVISPRVEDDDPEWLLHETELLRRPVYRTEREDSDRSRGSYFDTPNPHQLPLLKYEYEPGTELMTHIGELNSRDMLVMSVLQQTFFASGIPDDGKIWGDSATFGYIARQIGMHPDGATHLIRASLERLATAKVRLTFTEAQRASNNVFAINGKGEVVFGFIAGYGWREQSRRGERTDRNNYIQLDPTLAQLIRQGHFTFLKAEVLRALRRKPLALRLYAWARTHRPNDQGTLMPYSTAALARRLGCSDTNVTRRRRKVEAAVRDVCGAAPDEFPRFDTKQGRCDVLMTLHRRVHKEQHRRAIAADGASA